MEVIDTSSQRSPELDPRVAILQAVEQDDTSRERAFESIVEQYIGLCHFAAFRITHSFEASQDVVQDSFFRAWRAIETFDSSRGSLDGWLLAITRNLARNWLRDEGRRPQLVSGYLRHPRFINKYAEGPDSFQLRGTPGKESGPFRAYWCKEILVALAEMDEPYRQTFELQASGLTPVEIANELNTTRGAAKVRAHRARKAAKDLLATSLDLTDIFNDVDV